WYTASDFSGQPVVEIAQGTLSNVNLYAKWTPTVYTITYHLNGGQNGTNPGTFTITSANISFADAVRVGYTFDGWYDNASFSGTSVSILPFGSYGNKAYYAKWMVISYNITYNNLEEEQNSPYNPASYSVLNADIVFEAPFRNYHDFGGWYANADFSGSAITGIPSGSTGARAIYAKWLAVSYPITYHIADGQNGASNPYEYIYADEITLEDPTRENFLFDGWYTNSAFSGSPILVITQRSGALNLYAKWQAVTYDIIYNLNGGSNPLDNPAVYDVESHIILLSATRANHNFLGWYLAPDFSGDPVTEILPGSDGDIMLYAKFLPSFVITYQLDGGINNENNPSSYTVIDVITLGAPTKSNYIFIAWYNNADFEGETVTGISEGSIGAKTLYAKFLFAYKLTYYLNGGQNDSGNPSVYLEDMTIYLNEPYRSGYVFMGWYDTASFSGEPVTIISGADKLNRALYARWGDWSGFMYYGEYPQTLLTDSQAISDLNDGISGNTILADTQGYYAYGEERYSIFVPSESQNGYNQGETYYFVVEPIKWRILSVEGGNATVITDVILDSMAFDTASQNEWQSSALRAWLNGVFYTGTFVNADNHYHIVASETTISVNPLHGTDSDAATTDNISLLSIENAIDFENGFNTQLSYSDKNRIARNSDFAKAKGAYNDGEGEGAWWLYTPGSNSYYVSYVGSDGRVYANGNNVSLSYYGVRPTMTLQLGAV
ncbi:MAG: InlB B-repeat-containing protein, partial [Clostridia bacterium]|nr:InlB B-repeat-containing protein [Clostridia bacterium]